MLCPSLSSEPPRGCARTHRGVSLLECRKNRDPGAHARGATPLSRLAARRKSTVFRQKRSLAVLLACGERDHGRHFNIRGGRAQSVELIGTQKHRRTPGTGIERCGVETCVFAFDAHDMPPVKITNAALPLTRHPSHRRERSERRKGGKSSNRTETIMDRGLNAAHQVKATLWGWAPR